MNKKYTKVFVIDDDEEILQSISLLLNSAGYDVESFNNINQFLESDIYSGAGCILLDVFLGGKTGLDLQEQIKTKFEYLPIIFISGQGNIPMSVEGMKKGALNFLQKPINDEDLFSAVEEALEKSRMLLINYSEIQKYKTIFKSLTERECEIFRYIISGMLNKQIAADLGIAEHTIKNHRLKITEKLGVKSVAEMVYLAEKLNIKGINS